jgi:hypothetical protein
MFAAAADFTPVTVTLAAYTGFGSKGPTFANPVTVAMFADDSRRLVRNATGEEVISETTLYGDPATADQFLVESKVTLNGRIAKVLKTKRNVIGDPDVDHAEIVLT